MSVHGDGLTFVRSCVGSERSVMLVRIIVIAIVITTAAVMMIRVMFRFQNVVTWFDPNRDGTFHRIIPSLMMIPMPGILHQIGTMIGVIGYRVRRDGNILAVRHCQGG